MAIRHADTTKARDAGKAGEPYLVPTMTAGQRRLYFVGVVAWFVSIGYFWAWWLQPSHVDTMWRFVFSSVVLAWLTLMPVYFLLNVLRGTRPNPRLHIDPGARVAMVVTKAPSEPFAVVRRTLEAMLAQDQRHDTWLADEDPTPETIAWCDAHGVCISTRKGIEAYHQTRWPRRTRCKEGNLAYFYDTYGYENYDFVSQLDADHVPTPSYLRNVLAPFADPSVGYVSAPSICDGNAKESWAARSRLYPEGMFHGPLQSGHSTGGASLCIGSHYAVRTLALKQAGGIGPELAEDHSTSLLIAAAGWKGRHAIDAIAHGDGPQTFADMVTQEFQWSRSLVTILLEYTPRYLGRLNPALRSQFLFAQLWYPLFAVMSVLMFITPLLAICSDSTFALVTFPDFIVHFLPQSLLLMLLVFMLTRFGLSRPHDAKAFSWEGMFFLLYARWPWVVIGTFYAVRDRITGSFVDFRVTPKGEKAERMPPWIVVAPTIMLSMTSVFVMYYFDTEKAGGFYWFAALNSIIYGSISVVIVVMHLRENAVSFSMQPGKIVVQLMMASIALVAPLHALKTRSLESVYALQTGAEPLQLVRVLYPVSGAGRGGPGERTLVIAPRWNGLALNGGG